MPGARVDIDTEDGVADAYLTRPDDGPHPAVLLIMDAFGLRPRIEAMADRIAEPGYVVLAPNVFYRGGRAPLAPVPDFADEQARASFFEVIRPLMDQLTPERAANDGAAYLGYLAGAAPGPVAISGYCLGARIRWRIAAAHPERVAALGSFHGGGLVTDASDSPHRSARELNAELYLGHADQDRSMTVEQIATLERTLDDAGVRYRSERTLQPH